MLDFIRIYYKDKTLIEPFVCKEENFKELETIYEYHSQEIRYPYKTSFKNLDVVVNKDCVYIKNSLHKLNNVINGEKRHNYNSFCFSDIVKVIELLKEHFIDVANAKITKLEFGLNVNTSVPAEEIIKNNVIMYNYKSHNKNLKFNGKGEYKEFRHYNYYIKIYDKAKQYNQPENILRFEIKFVRRSEFNGMGISSIYHLQSKDNLQSLFEYLIMRFEDLIIVDELDHRKIPHEDREVLNRCLSPITWLDNSRKNRWARAKLKKQFNALLIKYDLLKVKNSIRILLQDKFQELINK